MIHTLHCQSILHCPAGRPPLKGLAGGPGNLRRTANDEMNLLVLLSTTEFSKEAGASRAEPSVTHTATGPQWGVMTIYGTYCKT